MPLYERLMGLESPKIPVHQFTAAISEQQRGQINAAAVIAAFTLSPTEQTEVVALIARVNAAALTRAEIEDVLFLAERLIPPYNTTAAVRTRFGV